MARSAILLWRWLWFNLLLIHTISTFSFQQNNLSTPSPTLGVLSLFLDNLPLKDKYLLIIPYSAKCGNNLIWNNAKNTVGGDKFIWKQWDEWYPYVYRHVEKGGVH